jgi:cyanophycinase
MPPHRSPFRFVPFVVLTLLLASLSLSRAEPVERLDPDGIPGALVIVGGGKIPEAAAERFMTLAGGEKARLVLIPTAADAIDQESNAKALALWEARKPASAVVLHTRDRKQADDPAFVAPLREATGVWFDGGQQSRLAEAYVGTEVEKELHALLQRGGVIGGTSAGAAIMSRLMITGGNPEAQTGQGFDFLPGAVVDQHFLKRNRLPRLQGLLAKQPGLVGFGIDEDTALLVKGRELRVIGDSNVTMCLGQCSHREARTVELKGGSVSDLTMWRRAARGRKGEPYPPLQAPVSEVNSGSLVIVGGGGMPPEVTKKFIDLAGGPDALIVVLPTANPDPLPMRLGEGSLFQRAGAKNIKVLPARKLADVEAAANLEILQQAKGIWFGGGRQWRFVDAYEGTKALDAFRDCLKRGGVIGGSSAGATIQGDYLCRGSPLGNLEMMCEGYERGFAFLPGVGIDQHFTQRQRFADMNALVKKYPQLLGIGIDESTAIIVEGHTAEVLGKNQVHFYARRRPSDNGQPDHESLKAGEKYDLKERKRAGA